MCRLSKDYPAPIVDHQKARDENLKKFKEAVDNRKQGKEKRKTPEKKLDVPKKSSGTNTTKCNPKQIQPQKFPQFLVLSCNDVWFE